MAFKPNYNQLRNERNRAKEARKNEKKSQLAEETAKRKAQASLDDPDAPAESGEASEDSLAARQG